jgi:hypothetical protein
MRSSVACCNKMTTRGWSFLRSFGKGSLVQAILRQGLKPNTHFVAFAAWLKPCPCYKTASSLSFHQAVKSCPDTSPVKIARSFVVLIERSLVVFAAGMASATRVTAAAGMATAVVTAAAAKVGR